MQCRVSENSKEIVETQNKAVSLTEANIRRCLYCLEFRLRQGLDNLMDYKITRYNDLNVIAASWCGEKKKGARGKR